MISNKLPGKKIQITRQMAFHTDCKNELHSYYKSPYSENGVPKCRSCQDQGVEWNLTRKRNHKDIEIIVNELRKEWWRNYWWEVAISDADLAKAKAKDEANLYSRTEQRIKSSVGRVYDFKGKVQPFNDGYQTPYSGNIVYYAQHAMATCCRFCIEYWHGIPTGRELEIGEVEYLAQLTFHYIKEKMADAR